MQIVKCLSGTAENHFWR